MRCSRHPIDQRFTFPADLEQAQSGLLKPRSDRIRAACLPGPRMWPLHAGLLTMSLSLSLHCSTEPNSGSGTMPTEAEEETAE